MINSRHYSNVRFNGYRELEDLLTNLNILVFLNTPLFVNNYIMLPLKMSQF